MYWHEQAGFLKIWLAGDRRHVVLPGFNIFFILAEYLFLAWSKEALFYEVTPRGVKCMICPNECTLKLDELSDCRNRINKDNKLYTIAYGNPCAVHVDPIEKKPLNHFLPSSNAFSIATAGCNLACLNCQNWTISQTTPTETQNYDLMPEALIASTIKYGCQSIAYTYSEPITYFEYTYDSAELARKKGLGF